MSDLRIGCIGSIVILALFLLIGGMGELPANYTLRCLQALVMIALGFIVAVALFGRRSA